MIINPAEYFFVQFYYFSLTKVEHFAILHIFRFLFIKYLFSARFIYE